MKPHTKNSFCARAFINHIIGFNYPPNNFIFIVLLLSLFTSWSMVWSAEKITKRCNTFTLSFSVCSLRVTKVIKLSLVIFEWIQHKIPRNTTKFIEFLWKITLFIAPKNGSTFIFILRRIIHKGEHLLKSTSGCTHLNTTIHYHENKAT